MELYALIINFNLYIGNCIYNFYYIYICEYNQKINI